MVEHPEVFDHVGLLFNEPPGTRRVALHLVIRRLEFEMGATPRAEPHHQIVALPDQGKQQWISFLFEAAVWRSQAAARGLAVTQNWLCASSGLSRPPGSRSAPAIAVIRCTMSIIG